MGKRRLRFYAIKNEDEKKKRKLSLVVSIRRDPIHVCGRTVSSVNRVESVPDPEESPLPVSLPIAYLLRYFYALEANSSCQLGRRLQKLSTLPPSWVMASQSPVVLCKMQVLAGMKPTVLMSVEVKDEMRWSVTILNSTFSVDNFPVTNSLPPKLSTVSDVLNLISLLDISKFCIGNPELSMVEQWHQKMYTMHSYNGKLHVS